MALFKVGPQSLLCSLLILLSLSSPSKTEEDQCTYALDNVPYITFMGQRLSNHSFVDLAMLGDSPENVLQCHTNLASCCSEGVHSGEWITPAGHMVGPASGAGLGVREFSGRVDLLFEASVDDTNSSPLSGMYRCAVPTDAVNDVGNNARESVYVGLYAANTLHITELFMTENSDLNGDSPQFTITCVSMGGPVGCVVWRINKNVIPNPNATSVLLDRVNGMYVHNLTVSEVVDGSYSCSVANEKPTSAYEGLSIAYAETPVYVLAIPFGPTAIHVIWATVQPLRKTVGYRIHYSGPTNGSEDVDGPDTKNFVLTGLKNNGTYCVAIAVKRYHSTPGEPKLQLYHATDNSVSFSWTLPPGSLVDSFEVKWDRNHSQFATFRDTLPPSSNNYTVTGLKDRDNATYTVTVTACNGVGKTTSASMNFLANFAAANSGGVSERSERGSGEGDGAMIAGIVTAGLVVLAIAAVLLGLLVYHYKTRSRRNQKRRVNYSLAGPVTGGSVSPSVPVPPPRPDISTVNNRPTGEDRQYYTPMSYTYPNPHSPPSPPSAPSPNTAGATAAAAVGNSGHDEMNTTGHGYEYITVQK